jgi:hypothetical protein
LAEYNGPDYVPDDEKRKQVSEGGRKSDYAMRWTKQVGTIGIFTVPGSLTKKSRRSDVVSATRKVIGRNDINNLVGVGIRYLLRISCLYLLIMYNIFVLSFCINNRMKFYVFQANGGEQRQA